MALPEQKREASLSQWRQTCLSMAANFQKSKFMTGVTGLHSKEQPPYEIVAALPTCLAAQVSNVGSHYSLAVERTTC